MTSNPSKQGSRWGGFLSGAVAGLESRLDTILGEDDQASAKQRAAEQAAREAALQKKAAEDAQRNAVKAEPGVTRTSSMRKGDGGRLQDRLAKAMAKANEGKSASARQSLDLPSRTASPSLVPDTSRTSIDSRTSDITSEAVQAPKEEASTASDTVSPADASPKSEDDAIPSAPTSETMEPEASLPRISLESAHSQQSQPTGAVSLDVSRASTPLPELNITTDDAADEPLPLSPTILRAELSSLRQRHAQSETEHKEDINAHLERIDALQSKLTYLAKQLAEAAKTGTDAAAAGTVEKKLSEKDAQIAALMEEGQKLSKTELKHMSAIKKLRAKLSENEQSAADLKRKLAKAEQSSKEQTERAMRAEAIEKSAQEKLKIIARIERDVEVLQAEKEAAGVMIADLRRQLSDAITRAEQAEQKAQTEALEAERRTVAELRDEIADLKIEKKLAEDRGKAEVKDIREETARQAERTKVTEMELKGEISNLETKLEVLRSRTEEVSSTSDSTAKLLRQIEILQTQYALASENWQGIESTLTSRVAALEKERDDVAKRESDIRRKAREVNSKARKLEDELESVNDRARSLEQDLLDQKQAVQEVQARANQAETSLQDSRDHFEREKRAWDVDLLQKLEDEKTKWKLEYSASQGHPTPTESTFLRADSPGRSFRKQSTPDLLGLHARRSVGRNTSDMTLPLSDTERPRSSRQSTTPLRTPGFGTPQRNDSTPSISLHNGHTTSQAPSIHGIHDEPESYDAASSAHRTIPDLISSSTHTGPSVQLVERMSAAVRRLESEKAASKEELARLQAQRDEAREEVVSMMREVEQKRKLEETTTKLQADLDQMNERYETTLEMLGEKSEQVEELKNDVQDLKNIYRDLVEKTLK